MDKPDLKLIYFKLRALAEAPKNDDGICWIKL